jgi:hypothetical protein
MFYYTLKACLLIQCLMMAAPELATAIRVIGNGGGIGEMHALGALANLRRLSMICMLPNNPCHLNDASTETLRRLDSIGLLNSTDAVLEYFPNPDGGTDAIRYGAQDNYVAIASSALNWPDGSPRPYSEITALVFSAWLNRPAALRISRERGIEPRQVEEFAKLISAGLNLEDRALPLIPLKLVLHEIQITHAFDGDDVLNIPVLALEQTDQPNSIDFTQAFTSAVQCRANKPVRIVQFSGAFYAPPNVIGELTWVCGTQAFKGRYRVELPTTIEGILQPDALRIFIFNQRELPANCPDLLRTLAHSGGQQ